MKRVRTYKYEFQLEKGDVVKIKGIPFEYLGNGVVGGNTTICDCASAKDVLSACGNCSELTKIVPEGKAAMKECATPNCKTTFGPDAPGLPDYCPACQDKRSVKGQSKNCKCIQPCDCPTPPPETPNKSIAIESLQKLVEALEGAQKTDPVLPVTPWDRHYLPKGGLLLDNRKDIVYGPGCGGSGTLRIGDGCCN